MATRDVSNAELERAQRAGYAAFYAGDDFLMKRSLGDGRIVCLLPLLFGASRIGIGPEDAEWFHDVWDYASDAPGVDCAWIAAIGWDGQGEPEGWYRHPGTGRRCES